MAANPSIQLGTDGNWAIKEDNLLAYKKDGDRFFNKEFDFTRGSLATYVDKDGLIKVSGVTNTELITNGNFDTDSDWNKDDSWSISGGKANYDYISGRNLNSSTTTLIVGKTYQIEYTISNYISGSVENSSAETQISNNSNGTYTEVFTARYTFLRFRGSTNGEFSIDNVSVKEIQTDVPRIDFTDDATGHLLLEPQRRNYVLYSETEGIIRGLNGWSGDTDNTITQNYGTTPFSGSKLKSTRIQFTGSSKEFRNNFATSTITPTASIYIKGTSGETIKFGSNLNEAIFTLNGDWQRLTQTAGSLPINRLTINTYSGATARDIEIYAPQIEDGSYATSYIPTQGSTVTRNADVCNNSGSVQDFNSTEGVLYAEIFGLGDDRHRQLTISNGSISNSVAIMIKPGLNQN